MVRFLSGDFRIMKQKYPYQFGSLFFGVLVASGIIWLVTLIISIYRLTAWEALDAGVIAYFIVSIVLSLLWAVFLCGVLTCRYRFETKNGKTRLTLRFLGINVLKKLPDVSSFTDAILLKKENKLFLNCVISPSETRIVPISISSKNYPAFVDELKEKNRNIIYTVSEEELK